MNEPQTLAGQMAWQVLRLCRGQLRQTLVMVPDGMGGARALPMVTGLDFGSVIAFAERAGGCNDLFIEMLPEVEAIIVRASRAGDDA